MLDLSLSCLTQLLFYLPLETDLAVTLSQYLTALSASKNRSRLVHIVGSEFVKQIAQYSTALSSDGAGLNGTGVVGDGAVCRLSGIGLTAVFEALAQLFVRAEHEAYFNQVQYIHAYAMHYIYKYILILYIRDRIYMRIS